MVSPFVIWYLDRLDAFFSIFLIFLELVFFVLLIWLPVNVIILKYATELR